MNAGSVPAALEVVAATKRFGATVALNDVTFTAGTGRVCALLGPNGSGKSTLIRALAGYHTLDSGTISLFGRPLDTRTCDGLRFVHQDLALMPTLNIAENFGAVHGYERGRTGTID